MPVELMFAWVTMDILYVSINKAFRKENLDKVSATWPNKGLCTNPQTNSLNESTNSFKVFEEFQKVEKTEPEMV